MIVRATLFVDKRELCAARPAPQVSMGGGSAKPEISNSQEKWIISVFKKPLGSVP
jgi:hypothetical protein